MLLLSNIKNYDLRLNKQFVITDITHQTSNIYLHYRKQVNTNFNYLFYNYLLDLPDTVYENEFKSHVFGYHKNRKLHRENGPAKVTIYENGQISSEEWFINREDGPAIILYYENGQIKFEAWFKNGKEYKEDGPAEIRYYDNGQIKKEVWYIYGKTHREDGPAVINYY